MSVSLAPNSRLLFVSVLICAAAVSFFMCSASPIITQVDNGVKRNIQRSLYTPYKQNPPLLEPLVPTETGAQYGTNTETKTSGNFRESSSIIDHQTNQLQFSYDLNSPDNVGHGTGITQVWGGHRAGGMRPASSIFTRQGLERPQPRVNHQPIKRKFYNYPLMTRKSAQKEDGSPLHQGFSNVWPPENPQISYNKAKHPRVYFAKAAGDETVFSPLSGGYWSTLLPTPRRHYSGYKETNELAVVGVQSTSSRIQSSKFLGFASQTAPHAPSISKSVDTSVIKSNASPEKLTSYITDFSQGMNSVSSGKTQRYKKAQSYLFKGSQTTSHGHETIKRVTGDGVRNLSTMPQEPSAAQGYSGLSSNLRQFQQSQRNDPTKEVQHHTYIVRPLYYNNSVSHYGAQQHGLSTSPHLSAISSITQTPIQLSASGKTLESFAPVHHADSQYSKAPNAGRPVHEATRGSMHNYKPAQSTKNLYAFRGFENPTRRAVKEPPLDSSSYGNGFQRYSFNEGKDVIFKTENVYSSFTPKYSFGSRRASATTTTQAKAEMTPTRSSSPSGLLYVTQTTTVSTLGSFTSGFKEVQSESNVHMDRNQNHRLFRIPKRIYGLKGFGSRPLEGAEASVRGPDKSAPLQQDLKGFELRSSQIWQPKSSRIHRWYDQMGEKEQGTSKISRQSQEKPQSENLKSLANAAGSVESVKSSRFSPEKYKKNHKTYAFLGFLPVQKKNTNSKIRWEYTEQNPTTASPTHNVSSAYLTSAAGLAVESSLKFEPEEANKSRPVAMKAPLLNISTSSLVRGTRVKGKHRKKLNEFASLSNNTTKVSIIRLSKVPITVTYTDILGSASFSGVRVTTQAPTTTTDKDYFPNTIATTMQKEWDQRENTGRSPEANTENDVGDFSSVEEKKESVEDVEADGGMETFDAVLDGEENRRHFNQVLYLDATKSQALSEDISELNYLQESTGNISFNSMKLSDKW